MIVRCRRLIVLVLVLVLGLVLLRAPSAGATTFDTAPIDRTAKEAYAQGKYAFCKDPARPLGVRQQGLCELAPEVDGCEGLAKACNLVEPPKDLGWLERLLEWLVPIGKVLLYVLVVGIVVLIAVPVVRAILKRKRDQKLEEDELETPNRAQLVDLPPTPTPVVTDAEVALRLAEEHRARGELKTALGLYLAASLAALDRRGAIRIARHRTNGEYVRSCSEETSRPPLRAIIREVDKVEFGGAPPSDAGIAGVADRAQAIVRSSGAIGGMGASTTVIAGALMMLALLLPGCSATRPGADPAGDELPIAVLERNGFKVGALGTSLATMPIHDVEPNDAAPIVIVDVEKVPLEDEARAHMMRWVESGGVLVLFGHPTGWPDELKAEAASADTRDLVLRIPLDTEDDAAEEEEEEKETSPQSSIELKGARVARRNALTWKEHRDAEPIAFLGSGTYAAIRKTGKGIVLGVANDDLFTNVGMMPAHNAAALVTLLRSLDARSGQRSGLRSGQRSGLRSGLRSGQIRVARMEDGIPPPSNPFAALIAAGLGKGAWHALAAAVLLFLAFGIRHARPRAVERTERRAFAEHIEATAAIYGRTRAYTHALKAYGRFLETRLHENVPRGADPVTFLAARSGVDRTRVAELYERATTTKSDDTAKGDELTVIEELRHLTAKAFGNAS